MSSFDKRVKRKEREWDVAFFMAIKNVFHKKGMLLMIVGIIGLGFLSTMFSSAIISGLKYTIEEKVITGLVGHVVIMPEEQDDFLVGVSEIEKKVLNVPGVISVSSRFDTYVTLIDNHGTKINVPVKIINPDDEYYTTEIAHNMLDGEFLSSNSQNEILMGAETVKDYRMIESSDALDVNAGEMISGIISYGGETINIPLKIKGIYGQEFMFTDSYCYISKEGFKSILGLDDDSLDIATGISVKAQGRGLERGIVDKIKGVGIKGEVWAWQDKLGLLNQFVDSLMIISNLTAIIGVIIAFATIYIMVFINVLQKRSQIGIMKAIGITEKTILISYIIQSFLYGLMGTIFGIILTKCVLGYIDMNPIHMPMGDVRPVVSMVGYLQSAGFLLASALVAGYMASNGVIKEKILDAIFKG